MNKFIEKLFGISGKITLITGSSRGLGFEIAKGFGCYGERVRDPNEIKSALQRAKDSKLPAIIDVITDNSPHDIDKVGYESMNF